MISILPLFLSAASLASTPTISAPQVAAPAAVTTLSGAMTIVKGKLKNMVVPSNVAQSVVVTVGATDTTVAGCFVVGATPLAAGTPFVVIRNGSSPFASNFSTTVLYADSPNSYMPALSRRTVTISTTGALANSVGFELSAYGGASVELLYPACSSSGYAFINGVTVTLGAFPATYSIAWPTTAVSSAANVTFRADEVAPFSFGFSARGPKSTMLIGGAGNTRPLHIAGGLDVAGTTFHTATLNIAQNSMFYF